MPPQRLIGSKCHKLFADKEIPCPGCPGRETLSNETLSNFQHYSGIIKHKSLDRTFQVNAAPVLEQDGSVQHFVYVAKDITEKRQLEEDLTHANKMKAIGNLAGGIAHDFNNILSAIIGYAELAGIELPDKSRAKLDIDMVLRAAGRATELVQQILTFSRKAELEKRPFRILLIVKEAMDMMRSSLPSTIDITTDFSTENDMVFADPTSIHQVVVNLCTNALHAMKNQKGSLKVTLQQKKVDSTQISGEWKVECGTYVVLTVEDSGYGMDDKTRKLIFEPYFTTKKTGEGTGLGLAMVHGIVQECHGFIEVESTLRIGTAFHVYLPLFKEELPYVSTEEDLAPLPRGHEHILFVDDENALCKIGRSHLVELGYRVTAKSSSVEALNVFTAAPDNFDLVISDQTMPEITGVELARKIFCLRPEMSFILSTGYTSSITQKDALAMGIKRFMVKPMTKRVLAESVRSVLDVNGSGKKAI